MGAKDYIDSAHARTVKGVSALGRAVKSLRPNPFKSKLKDAKSEDEKKDKDEEIIWRALTRGTTKKS